MRATTPALRLELTNKRVRFRLLDLPDELIVLVYEHAAADFALPLSDICTSPAVDGRLQIHEHTIAEDWHARLVDKIDRIAVCRKLRSIAYKAFFENVTADVCIQASQFTEGTPRYTPTNAYGPFAKTAMFRKYGKHLKCTIRIFHSSDAEAAVDMVGYTAGACESLKQVYCVRGYRTRPEALRAFEKTLQEVEWATSTEFVWGGEVDHGRL